MSKWVIHRMVQQSTVIEADTAEAAQAIVDARDPKTGIWINTGLYVPSDDPAKPYVALKIDWEAVAKLPAPTISSDELHQVMRGDDLRTYYIAYTDHDGESRDLIVEALTPGGAFELWGDYYHRDEWINQRQWCLESDGIDGILVENDNGSFPDLRIFELARGTGVPRALDWHTDDLKVVAWMEQS